MGIEVLNVKDFGATGNGVDDDTEAILDAIKRAKELGAATIYLPQGTYAVIEKMPGDLSPFDLQGCANITFLGDGMGHSTVTIRDGSQLKGDFYVFHVFQARNIVFRDLTIDGNCVKGQKCLFSVGLEFQRDLVNGMLSEEFRQAFQDNGIPLSPNEDITITTLEDGSKWLIAGKRATQAHKYRVTKNQQLDISVTTCLRYDPVRDPITALRDIAIDEQTHGIQVYQSADILIEHVEFSRHFSDGIRLTGEPGAESDNIKIDKCLFHDNGRSGITCQRAFRRTHITNNYFYRISDQSIDYEPSGNVAPTENIIAGNIIVHSTKTPALTLSGIGKRHPEPNEPNSRTIVTRNIVINGDIQATIMESILFSNNMILGSDTRPSISFAREIVDLTISNNYISSPTKEGIRIFRGGGEYILASRDILISNNQILTPKSRGIALESVNNTLIVNNKIVGGGKGAGVNVRATESIEPMVNIGVHNNTLQNFTIGVQIAASRSDMQNISILGNMFYDTQEIPTLTMGVKLEKVGSNKLTNIHIANNTAGSNVTQAIVGLNQVDFISTGGPVSGGPAVYMGEKDPEGLVPAPIGSMYLRTNDGSGSKLYVKESRTDATGWVGK